MKTAKALVVAIVFAAASMGIIESSVVFADSPKMKMATRIPQSIVTPDKMRSSIGELSFVDGFPTEETIQKSYDYLDIMRAVDVFLNSIPVASLVAMREGLKSEGVTGNTIGIFDDLMDSKALFLTANTESIYAGAWLDLSNGPVVVESPPNTLGIVDDMWFRYVADLGNAGPDQGRGGRFLFLPPAYEGPVPPMGFHVFRSKTYDNLLIWRGFLVDDSPKPGVESMKQHAKVYPLNPLSVNEEARRTVEMMGGLQQVRKAASDAAEKGGFENWRWALRLTSLVLELAPADVEARNIRAQAARAIGQRTTSANARGWYITEALAMENNLKLGDQPITLEMARLF